VDSVFIAEAGAFSGGDCGELREWVAGGCKPPVEKCKGRNHEAVRAG